MIWQIKLQNTHTHTLTNTHGHSVWNLLINQSGYVQVRNELLSSSSIVIIIIIVIIDSWPPYTTVYTTINNCITHIDDNIVKLTPSSSLCVCVCVSKQFFYYVVVFFLPKTKQNKKKLHIFENICQQLTNFFCDTNKRKQTKVFVFRHLSSLSSSTTTTLNPFFMVSSLDWKFLFQKSH